MRNNILLITTAVEQADTSEYKIGNNTYIVELT